MYTLENKWKENVHFAIAIQHDIFQNIKRETCQSNICIGDSKTNETQKQDK